MTSSGSKIEQLNTNMAQVSSSNKPEDIATLAYIWGFPLVTMQRQFNFVTNPNVHGLGRGPAKTLVCARTLVDASFTDVVSPNSDTLYSFLLGRALGGSIVTKIPGPPSL